MKRYVSNCILLTIIVLWGGSAALGSGLESSGIGARSRGMGFAMVGMADDWSVIYYNPAGAAMIDGSVFGGE